MSLKSYFNPRSLAGATYFTAHFFTVKTISIHAPSRERLLTYSLYNGITFISIHAPSRERQVYLLLTEPRTENFNPRSLAGATEINKHKDCNSLISIHAPSRERPGRWAGRLVQVQFQSTLPRGSDIAMTLSWRLCWHFNPRSLAGATSRLIILLCMRKHFNPRSLAGATKCLTSSLFRAWYFNPRSLAGATLSAVLFCLAAYNFNPRSLAGATFSLQPG